jgi:3-deoxy-manno-octulosonate cytidylyltransferase (CMP-KDO synthetase)
MTSRAPGVPSVSRAGEKASCCIIIPARFGSKRYPGKPLVQLRGPGGVRRTLIEWSWRAARSFDAEASILVATDDRRILDEVERFGGTAVLTPPECRNGTERCAAAVSDMCEQPEIVVNLQGDAPLTPAQMIAALIDRLNSDPDLSVATPAVQCSPALLEHLLADRSAGRVGGTTVVFNRAGDALYFSKNVIPYLPDLADGAVHLHLGVYAYRTSALLAYAASAVSELERVEGLEQLRFLDIGLRIAVEVCRAPAWNVIELNNPSDLPLVEAELQQRYASAEV